MRARRVIGSGVIGSGRDKGQRLLTTSSNGAWQITRELILQRVRGVPILQRVSGVFILYILFGVYIVVGVCGVRVL